jgi:hypothetical protein
MQLSITKYLRSRGIVINLKVEISIYKNCFRKAPIEIYLPKLPIFIPAHAQISTYNNGIPDPERGF